MQPPVGRNGLLWSDWMKGSWNEKNGSMQAENTNPGKNLLSAGGIVQYYGPVLQQAKASAYFQALLHGIAWKNDEAVIFGKHYITKRKAAWYGNEGYAYSYSNTTKQALAWTPELVELKKLVEEKSGASYNACLLNLYHNGGEGMAWHSDDEKSLFPGAPIASLSLGAERRFSLRHRQTGETLSVMLEHGSLLVMKGDTQTNWLHSLPKALKVKDPRINLTFRTMKE